MVNDMQIKQLACIRRCNNQPLRELLADHTFFPGRGDSETTCDSETLIQARYTAKEVDAIMKEVDLNGDGQEPNAIFALRLTM